MSSSILVPVYQYLGRLCFYFINQPCASHIALDKYFYSNCNVIVEKSLRITFLIHIKQFAFQVHA